MGSHGRGINVDVEPSVGFGAGPGRVAEGGEMMALITAYSCNAVQSFIAYSYVFASKVKLRSRQV